MSHLFHLNRDRGRRPLGTHSTPGSPTDPTLPGKTPGVAGLHDSAHADQCKSGSERVGSAEELLTAAAELKKSRSAFRRAMEDWLMSSMSQGTQQGGTHSFTIMQLSASVSTGSESLGWGGPSPQGFPEGSRQQHVDVYKKFRLLLDSMSDTGAMSDTGFHPRVMNLKEVKRQLAGKENVVSLKSTQPLGQFVWETHRVAMKNAADELIRAKYESQVMSAEASLGLVHSLALLNALLQETQPSDVREATTIQNLMESLRQEIDNLAVIILGGRRFTLLT